MAGNGQGDGFWSRLSDEELLRISFTTDDPEHLYGLVEDVPAARGRPFVEFAYDFRGSKRSNIRCAHCRYPNHLAGFVIKTGDGTRFLCGNTCGAKIYGADFEGLHRDFTYARDRAADLRRVANLRNALPAFVEYLGQLRSNPAFGLYMDVRQQFAKEMPRLQGALRLAIDRSGGALNVDEKVRDFAAEERDEDRYEREMESWRNETTVTERKKQRQTGGSPEKPRKPIFKTITKPIGVVPPLTMFSVDSSPKQFLNDIAAQFDALARDPVKEMSADQRADLFSYRGKHDDKGGQWRTLVGFGDLTNRGMAKLLKQVSTLLDRLEQQIDCLAELPRFFHPSTLSTVATWATANKLAGSYEAGSGSLKFHPNLGEVTEIRLPQPYDVPSRAGIEKLRAAING